MSAIPAPQQPSMGSVGDLDPYPFYESVRAKGPLVWDESMNGWLVTSHELCRHVELNENMYRHPYADASQELIEIKGGARNITILQGNDHARMHRLLMSLFVPRAVDQYRDIHIKPIIRGLIDKIVTTGRAELTREFSDQIPPRVILSLLAMPWDNEDLVRRVLHLHDEVMEWIGNQNKGDTTEKARAASQEINSMLLPFVQMRRDNPGDDLISRVWAEAPRYFENFGEADALATCREMFLAGSDTTVHALANAIYIMLTQPEVMDAIRNDREKALANFVEEVLRIYGSVQYRFRLVNEDGELGGTPVKKNQVLVLINAAANRDPTKYERPTQVDLNRLTPKGHLAFNVGPRVCVGAALARAEMTESINELLDRLPNLRLDPDAQPPRFRFHYIRSFRPLHVLFNPARS
jgi:cytochrome P450